jgi:transposase
MNELRKGLSPTGVSGRIEMRTRDEVSAMLALQACGWGSKRIAAEPGCSRNTVKRWLAEGGWSAAKARRRPRALDGLEVWLGERFRRHAGNADVVRQELAAELGIAVSLRAVERAVAHLRQQLRAEARATVRFETRPGQRLRIDFGERRVEIGDLMEKVFFFVATRGLPAGCTPVPAGASARNTGSTAWRAACGLSGACPRRFARQRPGADPAP